MDQYRCIADRCLTVSAQVEQASVGQRCIAVPLTVISSLLCIATISGLLLRRCWQALSMAVSVCSRPLRADCVVAALGHEDHGVYSELNLQHDSDTQCVTQ